MEWMAVSATWTSPIADVGALFSINFFDIFFENYKICTLLHHSEFQNFSNKKYIFARMT